MKEHPVRCSFLLSIYQLFYLARGHLVVHEALYVFERVGRVGGIRFADFLDEGQARCACHFGVSHFLRPPSLRVRR